MASTEAPRSVNFRGYTKTGWDCQWTIRATDTDKLLEAQADMIKRLEAIGVQPKGGLRDITTGKPAPVSPPPATATAQAILDQPPPVQAEALVDNASYTFEAERLVCEVKGEKNYWKVQGGKYSQHGVRIWPEIMDAAGFEWAEADVEDGYTYGLGPGWTAYYTLNDKGQAHKVVNLAK